MLYRTILCATDGLEHSDRALQRAGDIARESRAELHVAHVCDPEPSGERIARVREQLAELSADGQVTVVPHFLHVRASVPRKLAQLADRIDADLIVVGSRGRSPLGAALAGSVSQRLQHETTRPLLVLAGETDPHPARRDVRQALHA